MKTLARNMPKAKPFSKFYAKGLGFGTQSLLRKSFIALRKLFIVVELNVGAEVAPPNNEILFIFI